MSLSRQKYACRDKIMFVATKRRVCVCYKSKLVATNVLSGTCVSTCVSDGGPREITDGN